MRRRWCARVSPSRPGCPVLSPRRQPAILSWCSLSVTTHGDRLRAEAPMRLSCAMRKRVSRRRAGASTAWRSSRRSGVFRVNSSSTFLPWRDVGLGPCQLAMLRVRWGGVDSASVGACRRRLVDAELIEAPTYGVVSFSIPYMRECLLEHPMRPVSCRVLRARRHWPSRCKGP